MPTLQPLTLVAVAWWGVSGHAAKA